jgi:hypothetical protein
MGSSLTEFFPAGQRGRRFRSDLLHLVPHAQDTTHESEKTMLSIVGKCYIVLRTIAFSGKDLP